MSSPLFVANWKMNLTLGEAFQFLDNFLKLVKPESEVSIVPPTVFIPNLAEKLKETSVSLGCQNIYWEEKGAFTGETSASMIKEFCKYVLVGHSERRHVFDETDDMVNKKVKTALIAGLNPIICMGETLDTREAGQEEKVVLGQLKAALKDVSEGDFKRITLAYEPVWAIGTGKTATPDDAQKMHASIRAELTKIYGEDASSCRILYGGSVKPDNTKILLGEKDIDGVLVGGASLNPNSFAAIVNGGNNASN